MIDFWRDFITLKLCIAGASGRMGSVVTREAINNGFQIVGAVAAVEDTNTGKTLIEAGICNSTITIVSPENLAEAVEAADVYISFTTPTAEISNLPIVANLEKRIVVGTTGFTAEQMKIVRNILAGKVQAILAPNFSLGVNILFRLVQYLKVFPLDYDFSVIEIHHTGKKDAPSGTARKLGEIISNMRGYSRAVYGRKGIEPRTSEELEVLSVRSGGVPGIHDLIIAGTHEMLRIEHTAFSRNVFAQGALYAAEWLYRQDKVGIYSMEDVLFGSR